MTVQIFCMFDISYHSQCAVMSGVMIRVYLLVKGVML